MSRFNISEDDLRDREILKENDFAKYENIEKLLHCQNFFRVLLKEEKFGQIFLYEYNNNSHLIKLSNNLSLIDDYLNVIIFLIIAYYQKNLDT